MFSFYGEVSRAMPCVICDAGMRVLFANKSAYGEPVTAKWINLGKAELDNKLTEIMEKSFRNDPYAIAKLDIYRYNKHCALLADRQTICGATMYIFALVRNSDTEQSDLPTELDGRRMLTACFFPTYKNITADSPLNAEMVQRWSAISSKAVTRTGKTLTVVSDISAIGFAVRKCNALLNCATAILAAYCGNAKEDIRVALKADRFGISMTFSAEMLSEFEASLTSCRHASLVSACFARSALPMLVAMQTAENYGFSISADTTSKTELRITLRADKYDVGDVGFKVPENFIGNTVTAIYAATELLI